MNKKWQIYEVDTEETSRIAEKYKINKRSNARAFYNRRKIDSLIAKEKVFVQSQHITKNIEGKEDFLR